jgi:hypothetical protein
MFGQSGLAALPFGPFFLEFIQDMVDFGDAV